MRWVYRQRFIEVQELYLHYYDYFYPTITLAALMRQNSNRARLLSKKNVGFFNIIR